MNLLDANTMERLVRLVNEHPDVARACANVGEILAGNVGADCRAEAEEAVRGVPALLVAGTMEVPLRQAAHTLALVVACTNAMEGELGRVEVLEAEPGQHEKFVVMNANDEVLFRG